MIKFLLLIILFCISCSHTPTVRDLQEDLRKRKFNLGNLYSVKDPERLKWHLNITRTEQAQKISKGNKNIIVAIIDTGIDTHHPDLKDNLWINHKEKTGIPGVDDDNNGYIDDIHGWNFPDNNNNVRDRHGHGTHVAGIIGGKGKKCYPGIAPEVSLMILKYYHPSASGNENLENTIKSIRYAINNGAHIINFSGGGSEPNAREEEVIIDAFEKQIVFVTAGGNEHSDTKDKPYYPASYNLPNIFAVGATNEQDEHSHFSNKGADITAHAPGTKIYSTLPSSRCGFLTGTSQSTPIFTGGAVLVKSHHKLTQAADIIAHLKATLDRKQQLAGKSQSSGRANLHKALGSLGQGTTVTGVHTQQPDTDYEHNIGQRKEQDERKNQISSFEQLIDLAQVKEKIKVSQNQKNSTQSSGKQASAERQGKRNPAFFDKYESLLINPAHLSDFFIPSPNSQ